MVDTDRITGAAKGLGGRVQGPAGELAGSRRASVAGRACAAQGAAETRHGRAEDTVRHVAEHVADTAHAVRDRAERLIADGRDFARHARKRGTTHRRAAERYADDGRTPDLLGLASIAFAAG